MDYEGIDWDKNQEKTEDHEFFSHSVEHNHKRKELEMGYTSNKVKTESMSLSKLAEKGVEIKEEKYIKILKESFDKVHPLFYLNNSQRKFLLDKIKITKIDQKVLLYSGSEYNFDDGSWAAFILLEGEVHFFNNNSTFLDLITETSLFGYDGPIFQSRLCTAIAEKNTVLGVISRKDFIELIHPFSQFATFLSRNILNKDKVIDELQGFKNYILSSIDKGPLDMGKVIGMYRKINSCLHPKCNSEEIDISAWSYALNRLPDDVIENYTFILMNKPPRLVTLREELGLNLPRKKTLARNRDVYECLGGKNIVVVRDMETDVLDFMSNLCIHIIESSKLRKRIYSPLTIDEISKSGKNFEKTFEVFVKKTGLYIYEEEKNTLKNLFGDNFGEKLINLCINHQDVNVIINKVKITDKDPIEFWTQNLYNTVKRTLGVTSWLSEIDDLVVDVIQGSKRTLLACISPHMYMHKDEILKWASANNIQLKTKTFLNENDKLVAYSYYYYKEFPEKEKERQEMNLKCGIELVENTFGTGVNILVINVNKLNKEYKDPNITIKPASKNHIILHLGYTFGKQSQDIIKPVLMLFGDKARSLNILGKCGGLVGQRSDIIVADTIFCDKNNELIGLNVGNLGLDKLRTATGCDIHKGPLLTVAGTILQNYDLLNFYKHVMGCVGLEMEGYFYACEVESSVKHKLVNSNFISRFFYYVSDLPLDPSQVLSQEGSNVSWDEGVCSMNAIQRHILNQMFE